MFPKGKSKAELTVIRRENRKIRKAAERELEAQIQAAEMAQVGIPPEIIQAETGITGDLAQDFADKKAKLKAISVEAQDLLADKCYALALQALDCATKEKMEGARLTDLSTFAGTLMDKARMMEGKPTDIVLQYQIAVEKYLMPGQALLMKPEPVLIGEDK